MTSIHSAPQLGSKTHGKSHSGTAKVGQTPNRTRSAPKGDSHKILSSARKKLAKVLPKRIANIESSGTDEVVVIDQPEAYAVRKYIEINKCIKYM